MDHLLGDIENIIKKQVSLKEVDHLLKKLHSLHHSLHITSNFVKILGHRVLRKIRVFNDPTINKAKKRCLTIVEHESMGLKLHQKLKPLNYKAKTKKQRKIIPVNFRDNVVYADFRNQEKRKEA